MSCSNGGGVGAGGRDAIRVDRVCEMFDSFCRGRKLLEPETMIVVTMSVGMGSRSVSWGEGGRGGRMKRVVAAYVKEDGFLGRCSVRVS